MIRNFYCLFFLLALSLSASARDYHVDARNSTKGDGSKANPFQTIQQAANIMVKGDVCYIHEGTYRETIQPKNSGTKSKPIVFKAWAQDKVIISATEAVTGWEKHEGNIYKKTGVSMDLAERNNVYWNHQKMQIARWPNDTDNDEYTLDAAYIDLDKSTWSMSYISNQDIPAIDWTGGIIHYLGAHSGCSWERTITGFDQALGRISFETLPDKWPFGKTHSPQRFENGHRGIFYLMNKLEALDAPNEWYYDAAQKTLYFYPPKGLQPDQAQVEVSARQQVVDLRKDYIVLEGLNFFGGMVTINGNHNKMTSCMVKHGAERLITNLKGAAVADAAVQIMKGEGNVIEKCVLENGSVNGILLAKNAVRNRVENCIIQHFNTIGIHASLINSHGPENKFFKNSVYGSARDGVKVSGDNSEFAYNHVQKSLISGADGGLFYVTGNSVPRNIELHHNWFHDAYGAKHAGKKATGIYLDNNSAGYIVHHNVVWDIEWGGLRFNWNAVENEIYNNTFWNVGPAEESLIGSWVPKRNEVRTNVKDNKLYNNICDVRPWWLSGDGSKYKVDEKEYSGPEADNEFDYNVQYETVPFHTDIKNKFMPLKDSPMINQGKKIKGINHKGYKGSAPDLGAYEYGGDYWVPGVDWTPTGFAWTPSTDYLKIGDDFKPLPEKYKQAN
ncbi:right-handed parallel beta-helix repeat-containing protein [Persicobacter diffluens]